MSTDIVLDDYDGEWITVSSTVLKTTSADVMIDSSARRLSPTPAHRRAFVHDVTDGLTVNFNGDYPGGLSLLHVAKITPKIEHISHGGVAAVLRNVPSLNIEGGISFVWDNGRTTQGPWQESVDLQDLIMDLQARVAALENA